MSKCAIKALFVLAIGLFGVTSATAAQIKLGYAPEPYPPFMSLDASGKLVGWEVEFADAVCKEAKLDCIFVPVAWEGIIPALTAKKIDLIIGSMSITAERKKIIDFSDKYYNTPTVVIGNRNDKFDPTPKGLANKIVGVVSMPTGKKEEM